MVDKKIVRDVTNIIEGLGRNENPETISILEDTVENHSDEEVRDNARSVKALMALS